MLIRNLILFSCIALYLASFSILDQSFQGGRIQLQPAFPAKLYRIVSGYGRQLVSEILFIKTSVFLGGLPPGISEERFSEPLAHNFEVMTTLYPEFNDPYYFCQSFLAPISSESTRRTNKILQTGTETYPDNFTFHFFYGFNFFRYLDEPLSAAKAFARAADLPGAPPMFGHLAVIFSAHGGNIKAGLVSLKTMLAVEQNEIVRERYQGEIQVFEKALIVENAIELYAKKNQGYPGKLEDIIPEFLKQIPETLPFFILVYDAPDLRLERP